jgi:hypothetical protein
MIFVILGKEVQQDKLFAEEKSQKLYVNYSKINLRLAG